MSQEPDPLETICDTCETPAIAPVGVECTECIPGRMKEMAGADECPDSISDVGDSGTDVNKARADARVATGRGGNHD